MRLGTHIVAGESVAIKTYDKYKVLLQHESVSVCLCVCVLLLHNSVSVCLCVCVLLLHACSSLFALRQKHAHLLGTRTQLQALDCACVSVNGCVPAYKCSRRIKVCLCVCVPVCLRACVSVCL